MCEKATENTVANRVSRKTRKRKKYYLGEKYPGVYLTPQEVKCLFYMMQKFTSKKTSEVMKIQRRTVEYYRDNIRCKISADSKKDLIAKIQETNFKGYMMYLAEIYEKETEEI